MELIDGNENPIPYGRSRQSDEAPGRKGETLPRALHVKEQDGVLLHNHAAFCRPQPCLHARFLSRSSSARCCPANAIFRSAFRLFAVKGWSWLLRAVGFAPENRAENPDCIHKERVNGSGFHRMHHRPRNCREDVFSRSKMWLSGCVNVYGNE